MQKQGLKFFLIPLLIKCLISLIALTCRVRWHNRQSYDALLKSEQPFILSLWHNCSTIAGWVMRNSPVTVLISESRDGEYVARLAKLFNINIMRGSSSAGSAKAVRAAMSLLMKKRPIAITPDGPRGPVYKIQSGVLWFSAAGKAPILPLHIESSRQWVLRSWDQHRLPKPFSTIHVSFGQPLKLARSEVENDIDAAAARVEEVMMANFQHAQDVCKA